MLDIYLAALPSVYSEMPVYPPERQEVIDSTKNRAVRRERYFVWRLLEYGVKKSLSKSVEDIMPYISESGKWLSDSCYFSLAHTDGAVAVAISDVPVGIDIERERGIDIDAFSRRILTDSERDALLTSPDKNQFLIEYWTKKESIYKMSGTPPFSPSKIECSDYAVSTHRLNVANTEYFVSVCTEKSSDIKFEMVDLN